MNDVLMTNIFFTITAISSIVTTFILIIALIFFIRLVKRLDTVTKSVQNETLKIIEDVEEVRSSIKNNISMAKNIIGASFIKGLVERFFTSHNGDTYEKTKKRNNKKNSEKDK